MADSNSDQASGVQPGVKAGVLFRATEPGVIFRQRFVREIANLQFLSCGEYHVPPGGFSVPFCRPEEESLLFMWHGTSTVDLCGDSYALAPYDTLYVPRGGAFRLRNPGAEAAVLIQCSAPAEHVHPVFHSRFAEFSKREDRIRHLAGKDVYLMFDVGEQADKLVAGYTFFLPGQRSWPPHNHTDQEETYIFIKGHGSMEVYAAPETLSFVHNVGEGDLVTIPMLNYHPVFSQEDPLQFIWCIAGARYWVGDKNKDFMAGKGEAITT
jgi:mannose-6-phosphate isomerase-like protein (cupin superfamily)